MKKSLLFGLLLFLFCGNTQAIEKGYKLMWDSNVEPDLAGYKIYVGTESGQYNDPIIPTGENALATSYEGIIDVPEDTQITYYFAVTAYDTSGLESDFSNEVFKEYDTRVAPAAPKNLKWYERLLAWIKRNLKFWG